MKKLILTVVLVTALPGFVAAEEKTMRNTDPSPTEQPEHVMRNTNPSPEQVPEHVMRNSNPNSSSKSDKEDTKATDNVQDIQHINKKKEM